MRVPASNGTERPGVAWQGRRGAAMLGEAGCGTVWQGRRGEAGSGKARCGEL